MVYTINLELLFLPAHVLSLQLHAHTHLSTLKQNTAQVTRDWHNGPLPSKWSDLMNERIKEELDWSLAPRPHTRTPIQVPSHAQRCLTSVLQWGIISQSQVGQSPLIKILSWNYARINSWTKVNVSRELLGEASVWRHLDFRKQGSLKPREKLKQNQTHF